MELLQQVTNTQFLAAGVAVVAVLVLVVLVFTFSFKKVEEPQFDKSPLLSDDRKGANRRKKNNKDGKTNQSKKSPAKEKVKEKEQTEKTVKPKEAKVEKEHVKKEAPDVQAKKETPVVQAKKETPAAQPKKQAVVEKPKATKKGKVTNERPVDFDEGDWEKVPAKIIKKKTSKPQDEKKKDSPVKEYNNKFREIQKEDSDSSAEEQVVEKVEVKKEKVQKVEKPAENKPVKLVENVTDAEVERKLLEQISEVQRVLREAELRSMSPYERKVVDEPLVDEQPEAPAVENNGTADKKKEKKDKKKAQETAEDAKEVEKPAAVEKPTKPKEEKPVKVSKPAAEAKPKEEKPAKVSKPAAEAKPKEEKPAENGGEPAVAFDELGDVWTETTTAKKGKKKARKDL